MAAKHPARDYAFKQGWLYPLAFLLGALFLSGFSLIQKKLLGLPDIFAVRGFVLPVLVGGTVSLTSYRFYLRLVSINAHLYESRRRLQDFLDNASDLIQSVDREGRLIYANRAWRQALKYDDEQLKTLKVFDIIAPDERPHCREVFQKIMNGESQPYLETAFIARDGETIYVSGSVNCSMENGVPLYTRGIFRNVTPLRKAQEAERLMAKVFAAASEAIVITDASGQVLQVNAAFTDITGYTAGEIIGQYIYGLLKPDDLEIGRYQPAIAAMTSGGSWRGEVVGKRRDGTIFPMWLSLSPIEEKTGEHSHMIGLFMDITVRRQNEQRLKHLATHDILTDLPNRILFQERLLEEIDNARRRLSLVAVFFVDLDGFKQVNDSYGHEIGDLLTQNVADRLRASVRKSDLVARMGGDEFAIVAGDLSDVGGVTLIAEKLLANVSRPYFIRESQITVTISVGIDLYPEESNPTNLLLNADAAMYQAKRAGKNTYRLFKA